MILPTKHLSIDESLIGCGAFIVKHMKRARKIDGLWDDVRAEGHIRSYDKFVLTLSALYLLGIIDVEHDRLAIVRGKGVND